MTNVLTILPRSASGLPIINQFKRTYLNPYINYHRPCFFPKTIIDAKGKQGKTYPFESMMIPYDRLKSLPDVEHYLKPEIAPSSCPTHPGRIKASFHRIATRYGKTAQNFMVMVKLAAVRRWMKYYEFAT